MAGRLNFLDIFDDNDEDDDARARDNLSLELPAGDKQVGKAEVPSVPSDRDPLVKFVGVQPHAAVSKKTGLNSRGTKAERNEWNLKMQVARLKKRKAQNEIEIINVLTGLKKKSRRDQGIKVHRDKRGHIFTKKGLVKISFMKSHGRSHQNVTKRYIMMDFLEASFGIRNKGGKRILHATSQGLALGIDRKWIACMRAVVAGSVFAQQASRLAKLFVLCKRNPPVVVGLREAFDETAQQISVSGERGSWQIIVLKHRLTIVWAGVGGQGPKVLNMPIICPPLLVLSPSADRLPLDFDTDRVIGKGCFC